MATNSHFCLRYQKRFIGLRLPCINSIQLLCFLFHNPSQTKLIRSIFLVTKKKVVSFSNLMLPNTHYFFFLKFLILLISVSTEQSLCYSIVFRSPLFEILHNVWKKRNSSMTSHSKFYFIKVNCCKMFSPIFFFSVLHR